MITFNGHYILSIADWTTICKHFSLNPRSVSIKEFPSLTFIETRVTDIYSKKVLFSFYDHDGMIRIPGDKDSVAEYEIDIHKVIGKNPDAPSQEIIQAIKKNTSGGLRSSVTKVAEAITDKISPEK